MKSERATTLSDSLSEMTETSDSPERRHILLQSLLNMDASLEVIQRGLSKLPWDYFGPELQLTRKHLTSVLKRFLAGNLSQVDVEAWANAIECREDVDYVSEVVVQEILHELANPSLTYLLSPQRAQQLLVQLQRMIPPD